MLPDTQERYQNSALFADINEDMNEEELKISNSTKWKLEPFNFSDSFLSLRFSQNILSYSESAKCVWLSVDVTKNLFTVPLSLSPRFF